MTSRVLQASSLETKQTWVKRLRELIQESLMYIGSAFRDNISKPMFKLPPNAVPRTPKYARYAQIWRMVRRNRHDLNESTPLCYKDLNESIRRHFQGFE